MPEGFELHTVLQQAVEEGASDLHLTVESPPIFRINGRLYPLPVPPLNKTTVTAVIEGMLTESHKQVLERLGQVDFSYSVSGTGRFRVNVYRQRGSLAAALRVIPRQVPTLEMIGAPPVLGTLARKTSGLILVTGPAGSGKSTTLAAIIDRINSERSCHVVTLEDPIEYLHRHKKSIVNQREIGSDVPNFSRALRAVLRQDPDVIMLGEVRDLETITVALTAAETGRLVLASLNTANTVQAVERLVEGFPPHVQEMIRVQLSATLQAVISQTLVPRADGSGRVAAFEILIATPAVRNLIRGGKFDQLPSAIQTGTKFGMFTMELYLQRLMDAKIISEEEFRSRTGNRTTLPLV